MAAARELHGPGERDPVAVTQPPGGIRVDRAGEQAAAQAGHAEPAALFLGEGGPQKAYAFAQKLQHKRIGIVGSSEIIFGQYGFFGNPPTNEVEYIGVPGPHGAYRLATTCPQLVQRINAGDYDYVIMSQYTQDSSQSEFWYPIYAWVKNEPALKKVIEENEIVPESDYVFKVEGKLSPRYCPSAKGETQAKHEARVEEFEGE